MRARVLRPASAALAGVLLFSGTAFAKVLPVTDLRVTTPRPSAGHRIGVMLTLDPASGIGGAAVTNGEVQVLPERRADAEGWPMSRLSGRAVVLRSMGDGEFRGSFVVRHAGRFAVFALSSFDAHQMLQRGVSGIPTNLAPPVWVTVEG